MVSHGTWFNQSCLIKFLIRTLDVELSGANWLVKLQIYWKSGAPWFCGNRSSSMRDPPRPWPLYLFIWLFICILYNKTVTVNTELSWVLWVVPANYQTWEGCGRPWICNYPGRSRGSLETPEICSWGLKWGSLGTLNLNLTSRIFINSR